MTAPQQLGADRCNAISGRHDKNSMECGTVNVNAPGTITLGAITGNVSGTQTFTNTVRLKGQDAAR